MLVWLMRGGGRWIEVNPLMPVYKGTDGRRSGATAIPEGEVEGHVRWYWEAVRACRPWKLRGHIRWHWERHVRVQILEVEEAMVSELSLPKPRGHVLSP
jgi:hypothetical protein